MVVEQLRCAGVIEAIRISRSQYPNRLPHNEFLDHFSNLLRGGSDAAAAAATDAATDAAGGGAGKSCTAVMEHLGFQSPDDFQVGATKIYLQTGDVM